MLKGGVPPPDIGDTVPLAGSPRPSSLPSVLESRCPAAPPPYTCPSCSSAPVSPPPPLQAHAGADNEVECTRGISAAAKAQRGAGSCERSTHAEVTHSLVTRRVVG